MEEKNEEVKIDKTGVSSPKIIQEKGGDELEAV